MMHVVLMAVRHTCPHNLWRVTMTRSVGIVAAIRECCTVAGVSILRPKTHISNASISYFYVFRTEAYRVHHVNKRVLRCYPLSYILRLSSLRIRGHVTEMIEESARCKTQVVSTWVSYKTIDSWSKQQSMVFRRNREHQQLTLLKVQAGWSWNQQCYSIKS